MGQDFTVLAPLVIDNPSPGRWRCELSFSDPGPPDGYYQVAVMAMDPTYQVVTQLSAQGIRSGQPIQVEVMVLRQGEPVPGVSVKGRGSALMGIPDSVEFHDDAAHGDATANDGRYTAVLNPLTTETTLWGLPIEVTDHQRFQRYLGVSVWVEKKLSD